MPLLAVCTGTTVVSLWDVDQEDGRTVAAPHPLLDVRRSLRAMDLAPCGSFLAVVSGGNRVEVFETGGDRKQLMTIVPSSPVHRCHSCAISNAGDLIATAGAEFGVQIWSAETGDLLSTIPMPQIRTMMFSGDDGQLACADGRVMRVFSRVSHGNYAKTRALRGHRRRVLDMSWHPGGVLLASTAQEPNALVYDVDSGQTTALYHFGDAGAANGANNVTQAVAFCPRGDVLAFGEPRMGVTIVSVATLETIQHIAMPATASRLWQLSWDPLGVTLAVACTGEVVLLSRQSAGGGLGGDGDGDADADADADGAREGGGGDLLAVSTVLRDVMATSLLSLVFARELVLPPK